MLMDNTNNERNEIITKGENVKSAVVPTEMKKPKKHSNGKKKLGIVSLVIGLATLAAGVTFLLINLLRPPVVRDADFLVEVGAWQMQGEPTVVWEFTEIGKGTLTTNFHINDYDFIWSMDDKTLKIETDWLYTLNDEYDYKLNQNDKTLTLTSGEDTYIFVPADYPANKDDEKSSEES